MFTDHTCRMRGVRTDRMTDAEHAAYLERVLLDRRVVDLETGDWLWPGASCKGYGRMTVRQVHEAVHVVAYRLWVGPVPEGKILDHVAARGCRSTLCFRPDHLEPVTQQENVLRGNGLAAQNARKDQCPRGHPYDAQNNRGERLCRACANAARRRSRSRQRRLSP